MMNDLRRWRLLVEADAAMMDRAAAIVLDWVNQEHRDTQTWAHLFASVQSVLDETKPKTPMRLYRNERRDDEGQYDRFTSWTTDSAMAADYPAGGGRDRQLVSAMIAPKDMVCFIPALGPRVDWLGQQEMIVRPGRYQRMAFTEGQTRLSEARIIAYHGTGSKITQFHDGFLVPHYFTQDLNYARAYMGGKTATRRRGSRDYIVTVELTIDRMFDTKTDETARAYYNEKFVPFINPHRQRLGKPPAPVIAAGEWPSFVVADHLWGFMLEDEAPYDGMLINEGGLTDAPAIIPFRASQIKVLKNQIVKT